MPIKFRFLWSSAPYIVKRPKWLPEGDIWVYKKEEGNLPPYVTLAELPSKIQSMDIGDYAETLDGYITPLVWRGKWRDTPIGRERNIVLNMLRFAIRYGQLFNELHIINGERYPCYNRKAAAYMNYWGKYKKIYRSLTREETEFCWRVAQNFNPVKVAEEIFSLTNRQHASAICCRMFKKKEFKRA